MPHPRTAALLLALSVLGSSCGLIRIEGGLPSGAEQAAASTVERPACEARPVKLTYRFDPATTARDKQIMQDAMRLARDHFPLIFPRFERYSYDDEGYICFPGHYTEPVTTTAEPPPDNRIAHYQPGFGITVFVSSPWWRNAPESYRYTIMFHEAYHWYQELASKDETTLNGFRRTNPLWLVEGTAEWLAYEAAVEFDRYPDMEAIRSLLTPLVRYDGGELKTFETRERDASDAYPFFFTAVDRLIRDHGGLEALRSYWDFKDDDVSWKVIFQRSFGISVKKFYAELAAE